MLANQHPLPALRRRRGSHLLCVDLLNTAYPRKRSKYYSNRLLQIQKDAKRGIIPSYHLFRRGVTWREERIKDALKWLWGNLPGKLRMAQCLFLKELRSYHISRLLKHKRRMKGEKKKCKKQAMKIFESNKINHQQRVLA